MIRFFLKYLDKTLFHLEEGLFCGSSISVLYLHILEVLSAYLAACIIMVAVSLYIVPSHSELQDSIYLMSGNPKGGRYIKYNV